MSANPPIPHYFLAFVSPEREVYVTSRTSSNFRKLYKDHWQGKHVETGPLFYDSRPRLFLLETVDVPVEKASGRRIQWSRCFHEHGYTVVNWSNICPYVARPHPDDKAVYKQVRKYNLRRLCAPERDLAVDYLFEHIPHTIKIVATPEEWQEIRRDATDKGLPVDTYVRERFYSGTVSTLALSELRRCEQYCRQVVTLLDRETKAALLQGNAAGPAVETLQAITENLRIAAREVTAGIQHYLEVTKR